MEKTLEEVLLEAEAWKIRAENSSLEIVDLRNKIQSLETELELAWQNYSVLAAEATEHLDKLGY